MVMRDPHPPAQAADPEEDRALPSTTPVCCHRCIAGVETQQGNMECHYNPPVVSRRSDHISVWPVVQPTDWCAKYNPRTTPR